MYVTIYIKMQAMPSGSALTCLLNIQSSPQCLIHKTKKQLHYTLNTLHQTLHDTITILQTRIMSQISQLSKLAIIITVSVVTKAPFCHFFLHQTQSKHDGNVREKAWQTLFFVKSGFGRAGASVDSGGGPWGWASS